MTMKRYTIAELQQMRESEDHVEFKKGELISKALAIGLQELKEKGEI